jgi:hypothetical protein
LHGETFRVQVSGGLLTRAVQKDGAGDAVPARGSV